MIGFIGQIVQGTQIGRQKYVKYIFVQCPSCKETRWVRLEKYQSSISPCRPCSIKTQKNLMAVKFFPKNQK